MASAPANVAGEWAIAADRLSKRFGSFAAVQDVELAIPHGDIFGFLGPNGAGKTTTMRLLLGLLRPTAGRALVLGVDMTRQAERVRHRLGYVSQRFGLYGDLSVSENMAFYARVYGVAEEDYEQRRRWVLDRMGLAGREEVLARQLPGGYRQRLALACAVLHQPEVLFLDEPTAGVDPISRQALWEFFRTLAAEGRTVFVTTHTMEEAENCRHLAVMDAGRLVLTGSPGEIREAVTGRVIEIECDRPEAGLAVLVAAQRARSLVTMDIAYASGRIRLLGGPEGDWPAQAREQLAAAGVHVRSLEVADPTLEDAFLLAVGRAAPREGRGDTAPFVARTSTGERRP